MHRLTFTVDEAFDGARLKTFLRMRCLVSCRMLARLKTAPGAMLRNGEPIRAIDPVARGDVIELTLPEDERPMLPIADERVRVLYEDESFLILDKPAQMAVHPTGTFKGVTLANAAAAYRLAHGEEGAFRPLNRLDRDTSGVVASAKDAFACASTAKRMQKEYLAVVCGMLEGSGTIDRPIRQRPDGYLREVSPDGAPSVTHWTALASGAGLTLLRVRLETGRTHQIRVHFASLGCPLCGDAAYGTASEWIGRQALHCRRVWFPHPLTGGQVEAVSEPPPDFQALVRRMEGSTCPI